MTSPSIHLHIYQAMSLSHSFPPPAYHFSHLSIWIPAYNIRNVYCIHNSDHDFSICSHSMIWIMYTIHICRHTCLQYTDIVVYIIQIITSPSAHLHIQPFISLFIYLSIYSSFHVSRQYRTCVVCIIMYRHGRVLYTWMCRIYMVMCIHNHAYTWMCRIYMMMCINPWSYEVTIMTFPSMTFPSMTFPSSK